ncbi:nucleoside hydrolase [Pseudomonas gingeri]|uniref:nucleoside hydrolase n=1 Tax=Pseudomonas gingeri TaxID=117681 RepID=UPI0015A096BF|nr:nucleoside hydrolase [Pseudomonas gingeri]NVZ27972.1 nucleoside hydrolase [Pseudomonas gingeri]
MMIQRNGLRTFHTLALLLALSLFGAMTDAATAKRRIIVDQDAWGPAGSNLKSLLMLLYAPDVEVLGFTVSSGDGWRDENVASLLRLLEVVGRTDVPVYPGAVFPLVNSEVRTRRWEALYGPLVYKGAWSTGVAGKHPQTPFEIPAFAQGLPHAQPAAQSAAQFMVDMVRRYPGEVTIWSGGPLTNVALAARLDPQFAAQARELVFMGGSFLPEPANNTFADEYRQTPRQEFNMRFDPEAASLVLHEPWRRITQIPVDPSTRTLWSKDDDEEIARTGSELGQYLKKYDQPLPMWDEIAAGVWLDPSLIRHRMTVLVDIDTSFTAGYGNTLSWPQGKGPGLGERAVEVITDVDVPGLMGQVKTLLKAVR